MRLYDAAPPLARFLVYWQHDDQQLFAFTTSVRASTPRAARAIAGHQVPRSSRILGVKQSAGAGLRALHRGRWLA